MPNIRCATVQFCHRANDKAYNLGVVTSFVDAAAAAGVKVLAFPEMCVTGYWHVRNLDRPAIEALAEPVPDGPSTQALLALAKRHGMAIGAGLIERSGDGHLYNAYVVCLPDGVVHCHRKIHAFESEHISAGSTYTVFDTPFGVRVGILICWDNNLVENARATALLGATVLLAPHQTGGTNSRSPHGMKPIPMELWENRDRDPQAIEDAFRGPSGREWLLRWLPARAHDNGLFVLFANGVGRDDDEVRTGNSMILDPYGRILAETWAAGEAVVAADLDSELVPLSTGRRWMRGRRPELYGLLTQRFGGELDARAARFSEEPVSLEAEPRP